MNQNEAAVRILCYGDSITWARKGDSLKRLPLSERWTGVLQQKLGKNYEIIEEGLRGRMLQGENPYHHDRDGYKQFGPIYGSQAPLHLVLIFLGANDTSEKANKSPDAIGAGLESYFAAIKQWSSELEVQVPKILIISPPHIRAEKLNPDTTIFEGAQVKTEQLANIYRQIADRHNAYFYNAAAVVQASDSDGVHLDVPANKVLGTKLAVFIKGLNL